jgi:hypothetical protein
VDLGLYVDVVRRHRRVAIAGLTLTLLAAFFSYFSLSSSGLAHRTPLTYVSNATLLVTEKGFPYGRASSATDVVDLSRYQYLATLYSNMATSDAVKRLVERHGKLIGGRTYGAAPGRSTDGTTALPVVVISAFDSSAPGARALAGQVATALRTVLERDQASAGIKPSARVLLTTVGSGSDARIFAPRRPTRPIMIFLLGLMVTFGLVFLIENLRRPVPGSDLALENDEREATVSLPDVRRMEQVDKAGKRPSVVPAETQPPIRAAPGNKTLGHSETAAPRSSSGRT